MIVIFREVTVDACVIIHCDSSARDALRYRANSNAFVDYFKNNLDLVVITNPGIHKDYLRLAHGVAMQWITHVMSQSRYRDRSRVIRKAERDNFRKRENVPLHEDDFDYVDAASQANTQKWLTHETDWQNETYRRRIHRAFGVVINTAGEYLAEEAGD